MNRTETFYENDSLPQTIRPYLKGATLYDSSCSENAKTIFVEGAERTYLKIAEKGSLEREYRMTDFLHRHNVAPKAIVYVSDADRDYLLTEAVSGEDGTAAWHLEDPGKLATVFGESLKMLHSIPTVSCPYGVRTHELLQDARLKGIDLGALSAAANYSPIDNVVIHGDYCLPNIILDRFAFKGFIDLGYGGVGDRHYDLCWGIWTLHYNLKSDRYRDTFLDAYGRSDVDVEGLNYFTQLIKLTE